MQTTSNFLTLASRGFNLEVVPRPFGVKMKKIPLRNRSKEIIAYALVDDEDFEWLNQWSWYMAHGYASRQKSIGKKKQVQIRMHRIIMQTPKGLDTDHEDRNKLNNQRYNLRICTRQKNIVNTLSPNVSKTSMYKGVSWKAKNKKWCVQIHFEGKPKHIGLFENEIDAAKAYNEIAFKLHGEFAYLNKIPPKDINE